MKYVILVGDGMGDLPLPELDGRTPLEVAATPAMDHICRHGELLRLQTIPAGFAPGSDVANLSLLGYRPEEFYTGRAPLEAASMGVHLLADEIACRCNLVTLARSSAGEVTLVDYSAEHISSAEAAILIQYLNDALRSDTVRFYPGVSYRHLLVHKGGLNGLETVAPHDYTGRDVTAFWEQYRVAPQLKELLEKASTLLASHAVNRARLEKGLRPANGIWLWGMGRAPNMPTIRKLYSISGALISAVDLLKGIGIYGGLEIVEVKGATGYLDTNYQGKVEAALAALEAVDFVFVHVEAPDETSHQGLIKEKIQAIEEFDAKIVKPIFDGLTQGDGREDFRLAVAMDHYTPISTRTHASLPVPVALFDSGKTGQGCGLAYTEKNGAAADNVLADGNIFFKHFLGRE